MSILMKRDLQKINALLLQVNLALHLGEEVMIEEETINEEEDHHLHLIPLPHVNLQMR